MEEGRILVVGHDRSSLLRLMGSITTRSDYDQSTDQLSWKIDNKYYTADVVLQLLDLSQNIQIPEISHTDYQAIILVCNTDNHTNFKSLQQWWEKLSDDIDHDVKLAALIDTPHPIGAEEWHAHAEEWCVDNLIEFVPITNTHGIQSATHAAAKTIDDISTEFSIQEDQDGLDRIRDALQSHMWPGLQRKNAHATHFSENGQHQSNKEFPLFLDESGIFNDDMHGDEGDEIDQLFAQISDFNMKMADEPRAKRADAAAELILQLKTLLDHDNDDDSDNEEEETPAQT